MRTFRDLRDREVTLGRCLGRGGEGAVYSVPVSAGLVAKLYARRPDAVAARKLAAMVQLGTEDLARFASWPQDLLLDPRTGETVGFLMPRIDGHREIHSLYGPSDRKAAFPDASWAFLARAARNLAAAFDAVHRHGHVVGDVNQANVVVSRKATVRLIDCDSFQVTHLGRVYPCRVGVPLFTPPELHGRRLDSVERTVQHDRFGLAVLVFQLLFMGRHPFLGRHPSRDLPVEAAIREGLFAFGSEAGHEGWSAPPHSLRLADVPAGLALLFEEAFSREAAAGGPRPAAARWVEVLEDLEARCVTCGDDPRHVHARESGTCPWCEIERDGGPSFFFLPQGSAPDAFDFVATWKAIDAVRSPGSVPPPPPPPAPEPAPPGLSTLVLRALRGVAGRDRAEERRRRHAVLVAEAEDARRRLVRQWADLCGDGPFAALRSDLAEARAAIEGLPAVESAEWAALRERYREALLPGHLRTFPLEFARIPGLGPAEVARLASRGITTAADITPARLLSIPAFDLGLMRALLLFKALATRAFTLDPVAGIPGRERKALDERQRRRREGLVRALQSGPLRLAEARRTALLWREAIGSALARADLRLAELRREAD